MKTLNVILSVLVLAAAVLVAPAVLASTLGGAAGLLMLATSGQAGAPVAVEIHAPIVERLVMPPSASVVELGRGVVVFRHVNGKLVSRFYRDAVEVLA